MQIISGRFGGFKLKPPPKGIRPTSSRVKESLFDIIRDRLTQAAILDLFAGTGSLGLEALSANAKRCCFVDKSWKAISTIRDNIEKLGVVEKTTLINTSAQKFLKSDYDKKYDIVFLDPPYNKNNIDKLLLLIYKNNFIVENGLIVVESNLDTKFPINNDKIARTEKYGKTKLTFFLNK